MTDKNQDQIARRKAIQDTIAENRAFFEARMRRYYEEMDLGEWKPRLSPEERAAKKAADEKAANVAKIKALAEKSGISILLADDQGTVDRLVATEEGVEYPWDKTEPPAEDDGPDEFDRRDEDIAAKADAALSQG